MFRGLVRGGPAERSIFEAYVARCKGCCRRMEEDREMVDAFALSAVRRRRVEAGDRNEYIRWF